MDSEDRVVVLERRLAMLEEQFAHVRDVEAIKALKYLYCWCADLGWGSGKGVDTWMELFTEDAQICVRNVDGSAIEFDGREAFGTWYREQPFMEKGPGEWVMFHTATNPVIEFDQSGDKATGLWHTATPLIDIVPENSILVGGINEEDYVRTPAGWKVSRVNFLPGFISWLGESTVPKALGTSG